MRSYSRTRPPKNVVIPALDTGNGIDFRKFDEFKESSI